MEEEAELHAAPAAFLAGALLVDLAAADPPTRAFVPLLSPPPRTFVALARTIAGSAAGMALQPVPIICAGSSPAPAAVTVDVATLPLSNGACDMAGALGAAEPSQVGVDASTSRCCRCAASRASLAFCICARKTAATFSGYAQLGPEPELEAVLSAGAAGTMAGGRRPAVAGAATPPKGLPCGLGGWTQLRVPSLDQPQVVAATATA